MRAFVFLLSFCFCGATVKGQASLYHPIPDSNVCWHEYSFYTIWTNPPCVVTDYYMLYFDGDTVIGPHTYHKIYESGNQSASCPPPGNYYYTSFYDGALRQDTSTRQVYFVHATNPNEELLYDFNLNVGDTLPPAYNSGPLPDYVVGIDSVLVGNTYHKRFLLSDTSPTASPDTNYAIIEGVGSTFGLFEPIMYPFESGSELICFGHNTNNYPATTNCQLDLGITESPAAHFTFTCAPVPFETQTTLAADQPMNHATIQIYNSCGQLVKVIEDINGTEVVITRDELPAGFYIMKIQQQEQVIYSGRIVISD